MIRSSMRKSVQSCAVCLMLWSPVMAGDAIDLRPDWKPGQATYVEFVWDNNDVNKGTDHPEEGQRVHSVMTFGVMHTVEHVDPAAGARIKITLDRLALAVEHDDVRLSCDTDLPAVARSIGAFGKKLERLIGRSFYFIVSPTGRIDEVHGADELVELAEPADDDPYGADASIIAACLSATAQAEVWRGFYGAFAFSEVKLGDTWIRRTAVEAPIEVRYTLEDLESTPDGDHAVIAHLGHWDRETEWRDKGVVRMQSGPYDSSGHTVIDLAGGRIALSEEKVVQEIRVQRIGQDGDVDWWVNSTNSAKHTITVQSLEERQTARRSADRRGGS